MAYKALICQGDTDSASDCRVAYSKLSSKYGTGNITIKGFVTNSDTPVDPRAGQSNFAAAKNYDVLYWSSHGSSVPALNVIGGPYFKSGQTAYDNWRSTSNTLNVTIFAACYQFDGSSNRSKWANNIMRKSDIRAMCGYHDTSPTDPADKKIAKKFFNYANEGSSGNSVMYSWKNANATTSGGGNYLILVYYDNNRRYYRLPGFPGPTYPTPDRDSTKIYRYSSAKPDGAKVPKSSSASASTALSGSAPYTLEIVSDVCRQLDAASLKPSFELSMDEETKAAFYGIRENACIEVSSEKARQYNRDLLDAIVPEDIISTSLSLTYDDAMAEVLAEEEKEGKESIIGTTTQLFQHFNGILLEDNCIAAVSDADGVISLSSQWTDTKVGKNVDHVDLAHRELSTLRSVLGGTKMAEERPTGNLVLAKPVYIRKGNAYVLHYDIGYDDGYRNLIDAKSVDRL